MVFGKILMRYAEENPIVVVPNPQPRECRMVIRTFVSCFISIPFLWNKWSDICIFVRFGVHDVILLFINLQKMLIPIFNSKTGLLAWKIANYVYISALRCPVWQISRAKKHIYILPTRILFAESIQENKYDPSMKNIKKGKVNDS